MNTKLTALTVIAAPALRRGTNIDDHTEQQYSQMRLFLLDTKRHLGLAGVLRDVGALKIATLTDAQVIEMDERLTYMSSLEREVGRAADRLRVVLRKWANS